MSENKEEHNLPEKQSSGNGTKKIFYLLVILGLLLINLYLFWSNRNLKKVEQEQGQKLVQMDQLKVEKAELQDDFKELTVQLDDINAQLAEKTNLIDEVRVELEAKKAELSKNRRKVEQLLQKDRMSQTELNEAREYIYMLKNSTESFKVDISNLQQENQSLKDNIVEQKAKYTDLEDSAKKITEEKMQISEQKDVLEEKVERASVMQIVNIQGKGIKVKKNGKEVDTDNYKKADKIKVCFDLLPNPIADKSNKEIVLRLINPEGSTVVIQELGSGYFVESESGEEKQYTTKTSINYDGAAGNHCIYWTQDNRFSKGMYGAEVYHDGYMIGDTKFELKQKVF